MDYHWPGNVRELQNVVERALILNPSGPLTFSRMNIPMEKESGELQEQIHETGNLDEVISQHIKRVLSKANGKVHGPGGACRFTWYKSQHSPKSDK